MKILPAFIILLFSFNFNLHSQWSLQISGTTNLLESVSFINPNTGMVCGNNGTILKTTNAGINWSALSSGTNIRIIQVVMIDSNIAFALYSNGHTIIRTTNGGTNWTVSIDLPTKDFNTIIFCSSNTGWAAGGSCLLYKTTDSGNNWSIICNQSSGEGTPYYNYSSRINDTLVIFAGARANNHAGSSRAVFRVGVNSWGYSILDQGVLSSIDMGSYTNGYVVGNGYKGITTNTGFSWMLSSWSNSPVEVDFISPLSAYGINGFNIYYTSNTGENWTVVYSIQRGLRDIQMITPSIGVAVGDSGTILRNDNVITNFKTISKEVPYKYFLSQNYPNPFNPTTNIKFNVPEDGQVTLKVYDMVGNEVSTLCNQVLKAGAYNAGFEGSNLASGVYFYKLTAGEFTDTKKMTLIK